MKTRTAQLVLLLTCAAWAVISSGCIAIGTGPRSSASEPTQGQELMDLQSAFDKGAINQEEYDMARRRLLEK